MPSLLSVDNLKVQFATRNSFATAVDEFSLSIDAGECVGLVGESGCGKTTTGLAIMRLLPSNGRIAAGSIVLEGSDLATLTEKEMHGSRGKSVALIPQDPMTSLNPTTKIGRQIGEGLRIHEGGQQGRGRQRALEVLEMVEMPRPAERLRPVPLRALRRPPPARHHRDGPRLRAEAADRRRADDGARRDDPGPDPRHHRQPPRRAQHGASCSSPTTWASSPGAPTGSSSCTPGKKAEEGDDPRALQRDAPPVHPGAPRLDAQPRERLEARAAPRSPGLPPDLSKEIIGCRFAPRCTLRDRPVPRRGADAHRSTSGHVLRLLPPRERPPAAWSCARPAPARARPREREPSSCAVEDLVKEFPITRRALPPQASARSTRSPTSASRSTRARPSAWSASRAAARPPSGG